MKRASRLETARPEDVPALLELIEGQAAAGKLSLLYTRRPDPVASILSESPCASLGVIRDRAGVARFMESCMERRVFLGGEPQALAYIGNVRKGEGTLPGVNWLRAVCEAEGPRHGRAFCSILEGNNAAARTLVRRRPYAPGLRPLCGYKTFLFSPRTVGGRPGDGFFRLSEGDRGELAAFLDRVGRGYDLFPAVGELEREFFGLRLSDFYGIRQNGALAACGALWDQRPFRQYIVRAYGGIYALARRLPLLTRLLGYIPLPAPGEVADVRVLTLLCAESPRLFSRLLAGLSRAAREQGCPILAAGAAEGHPWFGPLSGLRPVGFRSTIYAVETPGHPLSLTGRPVHLEVGWL